VYLVDRLAHFVEGRFMVKGPLEMTVCDIEAPLGA
jgi:hypothetical protein